jgi:hypothetical protein
MNQQQDSQPVTARPSQVATFRDAAIPLLEAAHHHLKRIILALEADALDDLELLDAMGRLDTFKAVAYEAMRNRTPPRASEGAGCGVAAR